MFLLMMPNKKPFDHKQEQNKKLSAAFPWLTFKSADQNLNSAFELTFDFGQLMSTV